MLRMTGKCSTEQLQQQSSPSSSNENYEGRKRVTQACNRCRVKKIKCTGEIPCPRCAADDAVCQFGMRRQSVDKPVSHSYVNQLEVQQKILTQALKAIWKKYAPPEKRSGDGEDSIHCIVSQLGILEPKSDSPSGEHTLSGSQSPSSEIGQYGFANLADRASESHNSSLSRPYPSAIQDQFSYLGATSYEGLQNYGMPLRMPVKQAGDETCSAADVQATPDSSSSVSEHVTPAPSEALSHNIGDYYYYQPVAISATTSTTTKPTTLSGNEPDGFLNATHHNHHNHLYQQQQEVSSMRHQFEPPRLLDNTGSPLPLTHLHPSHIMVPWQHPAAAEVANVVRSIPGYHPDEEKYEKLWHDFLNEIPE